MCKAVTKRFIIILLSIPLVFTLLFALVRFSPSEDVKAAYFLNVDNIKDTYSFGEKFIIPSASISDGQANYEAHSVLIFPDGNAYSGKSFILDKSGKYTISYKAVVNGKLLEKKVYFTVQESLYSFSGTKSSAYYGNHDKYATDINGLVVNLVKGETFTFNKIIDLSAKKKTDSLLEFFLTPKILGKKDVEYLFVRFTDLYDTNNYIEIKYSSKEELPNTKLMAGIAGELKSGMSIYSQSKGPEYLGPANKFIEFEGERKWLFYEPKIYGSSIGFSWWSDYAAEEIGDEKIGVSYDSVKKQLYASCANEYTTITDLDDTDIVSKIFEGFTTGETIMTIKADGYLGSNLGMVITDIAGEDLSEDDFIQNEVVNITVDTGEYEQLPFGLVNKPYRVFDYDVSTPITETNRYEPNVRVYVNYYLENRSAIFIDNGFFTPKYIGIYTIEYSIKNRFGQLSVKTVDVTVKAGTDNPLEFNLENKIINAELFESVRLADYTLAGCSGNYRIKKEIETPSGKKIAIYDHDNHFIPIEFGVHTVRYYITDYIRQESFSYDITVGENSALAIVDNPDLPSAFVKGEKYSLPALKAYYLDGGIVKAAETEVFFVDDCNCTGECACQPTKAAGEFIVRAEKTVTVIYKAEVQGKIAEKRVTVPVTDLGYQTGLLNMGGYFQASAPGDFNKNTMVWTINEIPGDGKFYLDFINSLAVWDFNTRFAVSQNNFGNVQLILTDTVDSNIKLVITIRRIDSTRCAFTINDGKEHQFSSTATEEISVSYNDAAKTIIVQNVVSDKISTGYNGEDFNGFLEKKAKLSISLNGITGQSDIRIVSINSQKFAGIKYDLVSPAVYYEDIVENYKYQLNSEITIPRVFYADVLSFNPSVLFTVKNPKGDFAYSVDGILLDGTQALDRSYRVKAEYYGQYLMSLVVRDIRNSTNVSTAFNVETLIAPTITLGVAMTNAKKGDIVTLATAAIRDNTGSSSNCKLYVFVINPQGKTTEVTFAGGKYVEFGNQSITATLTGTYTIIYNVFDAAGNYGRVSYKIEVR